MPIPAALRGRRPPSSSQQTAGLVFVEAVFLIVTAFVLFTTVEVCLSYGLFLNGVPRVFRSMMVALADMQVPQGMTTALAAVIVNVVAAFNRPGRVTLRWKLLTYGSMGMFALCCLLALLYRMDDNGAVADLVNAGVPEGREEDFAGKVQALFLALAAWYVGLLVPLLQKDSSPAVAQDRSGES